jgi:hypothetical protein
MEGGVLCAPAGSAKALAVTAAASAAQYVLRNLIMAFILQLLRQLSTILREGSASPDGYWVWYE